MHGSRRRLAYELWRIGRGDAAASTFAWLTWLLEDGPPAAQRVEVAIKHVHARGR